MERQHWLKQPGGSEPLGTYTKKGGKMSEQKGLIIRELLKSDQERIAGIFSKMIEVTGKDAIRDIIKSSSAVSSGGKKVDPDEQKAQLFDAFFRALTAAVGTLNKECSAFFADLVGLSVEDYYKQPIDIDVRVMDQLKDAPEVESFFIHASHLYNVTEKLRGMWGGVKSRFDAAMGSLGQD